MWSMTEQMDGKMASSYFKNNSTGKKKYSIAAYFDIFH